MILQLIIFLSLLALGFFVGRQREKSHYLSIREREQQFKNLPVSTLKTPPAGQFETELVMGSVTISVDYFKRIIALFYMFFGGSLISYETLLDRARREAILRLQQQAAQHKALLVINLKYETASISKGAGDSIGTIEMLAYGTALIPARVKNTA